MLGNCYFMALIETLSISVCVCLCVCVFVFVCVRACVRTYVRVCAHARVCEHFDVAAELMRENRRTNICTKQLNNTLLSETKPLQEQCGPSNAQKCLITFTCVGAWKGSKYTSDKQCPIQQDGPASCFILHLNISKQNWDMLLAQCICFTALDGGFPFILLIGLKHLTDDPAHELILCSRADWVEEEAWNA